MPTGVRGLVYACALALAACVGVLGIAPQHAAARATRDASGGTGVTGAGGGEVVTTQSPTSTASANVIRLSGAITARGDGISIKVAASGTLRHPLTITGQAPAGHAGEEIAIQTTKLSGSRWTRVATAAIAQNGSFTTTWTPVSSAQLRMRAMLTPQGSTGQGASSGDAAQASVSAAAASTVFATQALTIPIFRNAVATIFGPGLWGRHTACGQRLSRALLGVASRTLKCGTLVALDYRGHELTVPVVDRGPYSAGVTWDLTRATATALGISETSTVGTLTPAPASLATMN